MLGLTDYFCVHRCAPGFLGEYCQYKDPCQPFYCLNGGNCSVSSSAGVPLPGSATCTCALGYTGQRCQTRQNSTCYPHNPCANKGVCTLLSLDNYRCECTTGWTGEILFSNTILVYLTPFKPQVVSLTIRRSYFSFCSFKT